MKLCKRSRAFWILVLIGPWILWSPQALARGWENGNAGDSYSSEFILTGRDLVQRLELVFENQKAVFDVTQLRLAVAETEVVTEDHVSLNGEERDAVNLAPGEKKIRLNRSRWENLRKSTETKFRLRLVLHEYLWISGVNDEGYVHSDHLLALLNVSNYSPNIWWNPVNPANYVGAKLVEAPPNCSLPAGHFDVKNPAETVTLESTGDCKDAGRKVTIEKSAGVTPPSSNVRGYFHRFQITVTDAQNRKQGEMLFEPEWGTCLLPEKGVCEVSGKMSIGGVEFVFWFLRN